MMKIVRFLMKKSDTKEDATQIRLHHTICTRRHKVHIKDEVLQEAHVQRHFDPMGLRGVQTDCQEGFLQ